MFSAITRRALTLPFEPTHPGTHIKMKVSLWLASIAALSTLAACGTTYPLFTSDGRPTTMVDCTGSDWSLCQQRAQALCPTSAYDVIDRRDDSSGRGLLVACKASKTPAQ
jgi:hypothetical protein